MGIRLAKGCGNDIVLLQTRYPQVHGVYSAIPQAGIDNGSIELRNHSQIYHPDDKAQHIE